MTVGVSRQTMNAIEKGDYNPNRLKLCIKICKVLNKSLDELFWEDILDEEFKSLFKCRLDERQLKIRGNIYFKSFSVLSFIIIAIFFIKRYLILT